MATAGVENPYKAKLVHPLTARERVVFDVTPDINESRNVNYKTIDPIHMPGVIYAYGNTSSRTFSLSSVKLVSRTPKEAQSNLLNLQLLRSWCLPRFGREKAIDENQRNKQSPEHLKQQGNFDVSQRLGAGEVVRSDLLGSPPQVLLFSAYSNVGDGTQANSSGKRVLQNIDRVPVLIQSLSIPYPSDVDYINAEGSSVPVPVLWILDISLVETHSPLEYERFSLDSFKAGQLPHF
ncbi:MAG: hypothetical protein ACREAU_03605 [Nitrosopumilaceae archaeon]